MSNIADRVKQIVAGQLQGHVESILESMTFESLGADSLDKVEIVMALEEEFGCVISDEAAKKITTVGDAIQLVDSITAGGAGT